MKLRYRILILSVIFLVSFTIFYKQVDTHTFVGETKTVDASAPTIPLVSFVVSGTEINETRGYTFIPSESIVRESITPVGNGMNFQVLVDQKECKIKKVVVTTMDVSSSSVIEEKEYKALKNYGDGRLSVNVSLNANYGIGVEYTMRTTLTTSEGRNIYYYTRLQPTTLKDLEGKLQFAKDFHKNIMNTDGKLEYEQYLEDTASDSGLDYSTVTLYDSLDVMGYGTMNPTERYCKIPTITEFNGNYISVKLEYWLEIYTNEALEQMYCTEKFRYFHEGKKNIVYNYTRTMDARFDPSLVSINRNQLKIGLTTDKDLNYLLSNNNRVLLFSRDTALWEYNMKTNEMICLYSLRRDGDYGRGQNREHDYKLISVDDQGNADFVVYGYITQGEYEGRVGILYYRYFAEENRLQEMMFVPVTVPYSILKEEFGDFVYMNSYDEFYFVLYDTLYLYQTLVNEVTMIADHLSEKWIWFEEEGMFVYQESYEAKKNTALVYYDLENRNYSKKNAPSGERIILLGTIDGHVVYGLAKASDITFYDTGGDYVPMYRLTIEEISGREVKQYGNGEELIEKANVNGNVISISLCKKVNEIEVTKADGTTFLRPIYADAGEDILLNAKESTSKSITLTYRTTDLMHREYYLNLPSTFKMEKAPTEKGTVFTVLTSSTSVSVGGWYDTRYYVTSFGQVQMVSKSMGEALVYADNNHSTVYNSKGIAVWKRGTKAKEAKLKNLKKTYAGNGYSVEQAILQMFFDYKGVEYSGKDCDMNAEPMLQYLDEHIPGTVCDLTGANLSEILAFISDGRPVIASDGEQYVLIIAYSETTVTYVDPTLGKTKSLTLRKARELFDKDAVYYSYVE